MNLNLSKGMIRTTFHTWTICKTHVLKRKRSAGSWNRQVSNDGDDADVYGWFGNFMSLLFGNADGGMCSCKWFGVGFLICRNSWRQWCAVEDNLHLPISVVVRLGSESNKIWDDGESNNSWHAFPSGVLGKFSQGPSSPIKLVLWLCVLLREAAEG